MKIGSMRQRVSAWFWGLFREPVCLDAEEWPRHLVEGDWYTSILDTQYEIRHGCWNPRESK
jgi:hypothetical protein